MAFEKTMAVMKNLQNISNTPSLRASAIFFQSREKLQRKEIGEQFSPQKKHIFNFFRAKKY
jgi:hypothetical protein